MSNGKIMRELTKKEDSLIMLLRRSPWWDLLEHGGTDIVYKDALAVKVDFRDTVKAEQLNNHSSG